MRIKLGIPLTLNKISEIIGKKCDCQDIKIEYISTSSKECKSGDLFIALRGDRFEGADFSAEAKKLGAYVISYKNDNADLVVSDTKSALLSISKSYKNMLPLLKFTVGITGSVGKSSTKEFLREILRKKFKTHATVGNFNNEIGVPLTILEAPYDTEVLVLEMGMNKSGEISRLSECAAPNIAIITNVGTSHIGFFGTREKIAAAKLEILNGMKEDAPLIAPYNEPLLKTYANVFFASEHQDANVNVTLSGANKDFSLVKVFLKGKFAFNTILRTGGAHQLNNLGAAISAALCMNMTNSEISDGILNISDKNSRQKILNFKNVTIIDDSYNSSLEATEAAFSYLSLWSDKIKSALLSDVLELGEKSEDIHRKIGIRAARLGIQKLYLFGSYAKELKYGAMSAGMTEDKIFVKTEVQSLEEFAIFITDLLESGELMLAKASHNTNLSTVLFYITERLRKKDAR